MLKLSSRLGNESHNFLTDFAGTHKNKIKGGAAVCGSEWSKIRPSFIAIFVYLHNLTWYES